MSSAHELARDSRGARHRVGREVRLREDLLHHGRVARVARGERIEQPALSCAPSRRSGAALAGFAIVACAVAASACPVTRQQRDHRSASAG